MDLKSARKIKVGDLVILKKYRREFRITGIDKDMTTDKKIYFWSRCYRFKHTEIYKIVKKD